MLRTYVQDKRKVSGPPTGCVCKRRVIPSNWLCSLRLLCYYYPTATHLPRPVVLIHIYIHYLLTGNSESLAAISLVACSDALFLHDSSLGLLNCGSKRADVACVLTRAAARHLVCRCSYYIYSSLLKSPVSLTQMRSLFHTGIPDIGSGDRQAPNDDDPG